VTVLVAAESTLVVADSAGYDSTALAWVPARFDTVRAFRIEQREDGMTTRAWIDAQGHIVRAENAVGFVMERTAFELAYTNFRYRDTTRLMRASAAHSRTGAGSGTRRPPYRRVGARPGGAAVDRRHTQCRAGAQGARRGLQRARGAVRRAGAGSRRAGAHRGGTRARGWTLLLSRLGRGIPRRLGRRRPDAGRVPRRRGAPAVQYRRSRPAGGARPLNRAHQARGAMIRLENLTKHYGSFVAVDD